MSELVWIPLVAFLGLVSGMFLCSQLLLWIGRIGLAMRTRASLAPAILLQPAPWLLAGLVALTVWIFGAAEHHRLWNWAFAGLATSPLAVAVIAIVALRQRKTGRPADGVVPAPMPGRPSLLVAPWAGEPVGPVGLWLARVLTVVCLLAIAVNLAFRVPDGIATIPINALNVALSILTAYVFALFAFVAVKGRAPSGWLPWR